VVEVTRRDVLRLGAVVAGSAAGAALLSACTGGGGQPSPTEPGGPEDPDRGLRADIGRSESALIALYAAAAAALAGRPAERVAAIGERHPAYRQAIDPDRLADATPAAEEGSTQTASSPSPSSSPVLPTAPADVLAVLVAAERAAAEERARQCVSAVDGELARVIVLAGAGSAAAAEALGRVRA
jgi:hypothetical protein